MKKSNLTGWKDVFSFTLTQTLKSKAFIISYVILLTLMIISMPLIKMITDKGSKDTNTSSPIKKVYINNETKLPAMDFKELLKDEKYTNISFESMQEEYTAVADRIEKKENESIILTIKESNENYSLDFVRSSKGSIKESHLETLANALVPLFETLKIDALGIKDEQLAMIHAKVTSKVSMTDVNGVEIVKEDTSITFSEYWFVYGILFVAMMVNIMASTQIAYSVATEKSTRVIEYLLTSVKPLALMVGKIIAMLTAVVLEIITLMIALFASNTVSAVLSSGNNESVLSQYLPKDLFNNINIINIIFCLILIVLGMIFYAALAGLAGATVSKIEEIQEGLTLFTFTNMVGVYIGLGAISVLMGKGINGYVTFSFLFPLSSPFILPGAIMVGRASVPIVAAAIVLQVIFIILLFKFVAKVYEALILHNGNKIKIKDLIKLSKTM